MARKQAEDLRSHRWFGVSDLRSFGHRSRMLQMGYAREEFVGKPVIAVVNSFTQMVPGHVHLHEIGQQVKKRIEEQGCFAGWDWLQSDFAGRCF